MKKALLSTVIAANILAASAQSQIDTFKLYKEKVPSAWSQRPDTVKGNQQQPISTLPSSATPVPPPLTNPIDNPTSGQTHEPAITQPIDVPAPATAPAKRKPIVPVKQKTKPSDYDTLPGTKRNG